MARILRKPNSTGWHCQKTKATSSLTIRGVSKAVAVTVAAGKKEPPPIGFSKRVASVDRVGGGAWFQTSELHAVRKR